MPLAEELVAEAGRLAANLPVEAERGRFVRSKNTSLILAPQANGDGTFRMFLTCSTPGNRSVPWQQLLLRLRPKSGEGRCFLCRPDRRGHAEIPRLASGAYEMRSEILEGWHGAVAASVVDPQRLASFPRTRVTVDGGELSLPDGRIAWTLSSASAGRLLLRTSTRDRPLAMASVALNFVSLATGALLYETKMRLRRESAVPGIWAGSFLLPQEAASLGPYSVYWAVSRPSSLVLTLSGWKEKLADATQRAVKLGAAIGELVVVRARALADLAGSSTPMSLEFVLPPPGGRLHIDIVPREVEWEIKFGLDTESSIGALEIGLGDEDNPNIGVRTVKADRARDFLVSPPQKQLWVHLEWDSGTDRFPLRATVDTRS